MCVELWNADSVQTLSTEMGDPQMHVLLDSAVIHRSIRYKSF